ncbi:MAG: iron export ABC transporter permease subunit FetB [Cyanobacteria bacterium]|nr:iron export ABC transporter permease subunit FetB [Cyanobacteria bacterium CG_2015-16_32_12]NCO77502.1 iron export ABC transporter permease subunit FetB [Cyanobacteria bacterium CG_2015-22_32_23]NCQ41856.1 iron export ABC transporter permease subunit FetB [Cyanobacteria bacterium CG_2015-04_32_10]NCS84966.1 iron export ABC transporter permease subunit FetB [Cyanobacteria bacterium CG_2015-02_32_10]
MEIITLDFIDLFWAWGIILITIILSWWQKLDLEGEILIASGRSLIQLMFIGYILEFIFAVDNPFVVILVLLAMVTIAAVVARNRISKKIKGLLLVVWSGLFFSTSLIISYGIVFIIQPENWYNPQYLIPLVGMILGNTLNGASLSGERLASMIKNNRLEIETHLSLGATGKESIKKYRQEAIRVGLIPIINSMMIVGIVSLPGMFTGQVLAGNNPLDAASYQILILFMIAFANLVTILIITEGVYRSFFNSQQQLIIIP